MSFRVLHGAAGKSLRADFEFIYEPQALLIRLVVSGSEMALQKIQQKD